MKNYLISLLFFIATVAGAGDPFNTRVQLAKSIENSADGQSFQKIFWDSAGDYTASVMQQCFPKSTKPDTSAFTLVANLIPRGALANVEVRPQTKQSLCFARGFRKASFPEPPENFGNEGMPLVIEMKITP